MTSIDFLAEVWVPAPGSEGIYEISDHGRVWSMPRPRTSGGLLKLTLNQDGYFKVQLGRGNHRTVHSLVAEAFHGPCPVGREVCHRDGDKLNNYWDNLYYGTDSDNARDTVAHGNHKNARKDECPAGHKYADLDVRKGKGGRIWRRCRECHREQERGRKAVARDRL